jgi:undecaprenyl-diphosphatase
MRGIDRVTATELSFFLAIPALTAAGVFQAVEEREGVAALGIGQVLLGVVVAFAVAYASIAWLLRFVRGHSLNYFVGYRVALGLALVVALSAGWMTAT